MADDTDGIGRTLVPSITTFTSDRLFLVGPKATMDGAVVGILLRDSSTSTDSPY